MSKNIRTVSPIVITALIIVLMLATFFRFTAANQTYVNQPVRADAAEYLSYAYNLRNNGVYSSKVTGDKPVPDAKRSPGYPIFLLAFTSGQLTDHSLLLVTLTQALLGVLTVLMSYLLFNTFLPPPLAIIVALLTANSPHLISADTYILTEGLFTFILIIFVWMASKRANYDSWAFLLLLGALLAMVVLIRPTMQFFLIPFVTLITFHFGIRQGIRKAVIVTISMLMLYSPWAIRNISSIGSLSDPTLKIAFLHHGMYPNFTYLDQKDSYGFPYRFDPESPRISQSTETILQEIKRRFIEEPKKHLRWYLLKKPVTFWSWDIINGHGDVFTYPVEKTPYHSSLTFKAQHTVMKFLHWPLVLLGLAACILVWLPGKLTNLTGNGLYASRLVSVLLLYYIALHIIGAPFPRYSIPLRPLIYGMAMLTLAIIVNFLPKKLPAKIHKVTST